MFYFDTSFLVPLFLPEATSPRIERFMAGLSPGELAVSHWTRVEFSSLLAREVRMGGLTRRAAATVDAQFESVIDESFVVLTPNHKDFDLAKDYLGHANSGLRAGDALHLAIAATRRARAIYSLDKVFLKVGQSLKLPVMTGM